METINLKINGFAVEAPKGSSILAAAKLAGIDIPTLCYLKEINEIGACRICMVEADEGRGARLVAACVYPVTEDLIYILQKGVAYKGWANPEDPTFLFAEVENYNPELGWMFLICYFEK